MKIKFVENSLKLSVKRETMKKSKVYFNYNANLIKSEDKMIAGNINSNLFHCYSLKEHEEQYL